MLTTNIPILYSNLKLNGSKGTKKKESMTMASKVHPGFSKVQKSIQKEGYSKEAAGAILANATRNASPKAKKANPKLGKVKGK